MRVGDLRIVLPYHIIRIKSTVLNNKNNSRRALSLVVGVGDLLRGEVFFLFETRVGGELILISS